MKIAHLSDIHFGRIANPHILDALHADVEAAGVDLVAVSGDLTQRALHGQFKAAVTFLERFSAPQIVVPGNHDVFPWWRIFSRLKKPVARFQQYFGSDLIRSFQAPGCSLLAVNSAHGWTIKGGKLEPAMQQAINSFFSQQENGAFKILVLHHHLIFIDALKPHDICEFGPDTHALAIEAGVDLILCGHLHVSHVETPAGNNHKLPVIASAGTATSDRGRRSNKLRNFYNLIEVEQHHFTIIEREYESVERTFVAAKETQVSRRYL